MVKKLLLALIAIFTVATAAQAQTWYPAQWNFIDNISYQLYNDGHAEVANSDWDIVDVTIPATIKANGREYKVTAIAKEAFLNRGKIKTLKIEGENLETIGECAFQNAATNNDAGIDLVQFPGSIRHIMDKAFYNSGLRHVSFAKLTVAHQDLDIHEKAFYMCTSLKVVELYCSIVGKGSFQECQGIETIVLGKNVDRICAYAFDACLDVNTIIIGRSTPPVCEENAFRGVGYKHALGMAQIENNGYDEKGVYHGTPAAQGKYGNFLHYVNVKLAVPEDKYDDVYPLYRDYAPIEYTENGATRYSYQGWQKDRTNQYYIEFKPNEKTGNNDVWKPNQGVLNNFGQAGLQEYNANFYYSRMTDEEIKENIDKGIITDPDEFKELQIDLTLSAIGASKYTPGHIDNGTYYDGSNSYSASLAATNTDGHDGIKLPVGSELTIYSIDASGNRTPVNTVKVEGSPKTLAELEAQISKTENLDENGATYCMELTVPNGSKVDTFTSAPVTVSFAKPEKTEAVQIFRSGTPDAKTCATEEAYSNKITIPVDADNAPQSYDIYCNGNVAATLTLGKDGNYYDENGNICGNTNDGIVYVDNAVADPIAVGENANTSKREAKIWNYEVVSIDANGNTCGSGTRNTEFAGGTDELALTITGAATKTGYSYAQLAATTTLEWALDESVNSNDIIGYEIYRSFNGEDFTLAGTTDANTTTFTDNYTYNREQQNSGNWVNKPSASEYKDITYYVKAITSTSKDVPQNLREKNSDIKVTNGSQGSIFTDIEGVDAEGASVKVANGIITVNGVNGSIEIFSTNGTMVAKTYSNGSVTEINATSLAAGIYVMKTANNSTKILIK